MAISKRISRTKQKTLGRLFPALAAVVADERNAARVETLEIMMDVEQVTDLFASLDDIRRGKIVGMKDAFGDL